VKWPHEELADEVDNPDPDHLQPLSRDVLAAAGAGARLLASFDRLEDPARAAAERAGNAGDFHEADSKLLILGKACFHEHAAAARTFQVALEIRESLLPAGARLAAVGLVRRAGVRNLPNFP